MKEIKLVKERKTRKHRKPMKKQKKSKEKLKRTKPRPGEVTSLPQWREENGHARSLQSGGKASSERVGLLIISEI